MAAVPGAADAVARFPFRFGRGDGDDGADEFVAEGLDAAGWVSGCCLKVCLVEGARYLRWAHLAAPDVMVAVADAARVDFD